MAPPAFVWDPDAKPGPLSAGFRTVPEIPEDISLPVEGVIPDYVDGRLFRNGPGVYEMKHKNGETTHINHWFDGIGKVHRFRIDGASGTVTYKNRRTMPDMIAAAENAPSKAAYKAYFFGDQDPCRGVLGTLFQMWRPYSKAPNTEKPPFNVAVTLERIFGLGKLVSRTDSSFGAVLDVDSLDSKTMFTFGKLNPELAKNASGAHGVTDPDTGEYFNYCFEIGKSPVEYTVFGQAAGGKNEVLAKIRDAPCYLHSLAATKNYVILIMYSCVINAIKLLTGTSYGEAMEFRPNLRTKFYVISRSEKKLAAVYDSEAFFCFHNINAFEDEVGNLQVDLVWYQDADIIKKAYRQYLVHKPSSFFERAVPKRFTLSDIQGAADAFAANPATIAEASVRTLVDVDIELPRMAQAYEMRDYRYAYGISTQPGDHLFNSLVKIDVVSGEFNVWTPPAAACGEPIFVPKPGSDVEDEGVLLSVVLDTAEERSFMVVLDAKSMTEIARATVPQPVPFGFHGQYMCEEFAKGPEI